MALAGKVEEAVSERRLAESFDRARELISAHQAAGIQVISRFDSTYPPRLRQVKDAPPVLFCRGELIALTDVRQAAVIGTRDPGQFGRTATETLTRALADGGFTIVSGLARGVDGIAHRTALAAEARTIAVLGGGLDVIYPAEHAELAEQIVAAGGTLISEHPFGVTSEPRNLIARDRIQSGISAIVLACQCGLRSGTMHTVRCACEQGRPVFCPQPKSSHPANGGLRVLLECPASELSQRLPAWRGQGALCRRLGRERVARPVTREGTPGFISEAQRIADA